MKKLSLLSYIFLILPALCFGELFGPSNYEDCVLRGIKDAKTDSAIGTLHSMCRKKFSEESNKIPKLCILYWDGLRSVKLTSEPKNWRDNYSKFSITKHGNEVAHIFTQKNFQATPESDAEMYQQVSYACR